MQRLDSDAFSRARHFLATQGRPVDRAIFEHQFSAGPADAVIRTLSEYQNADGGFGHALESDVRTPASSALATSIGLRILADLGVSADHPSVSRAVGYLRDTLDESEHVWRIIAPDSNDFPHAPWWHDEDGSVKVAFGGFRVNPRAELVGLLHTFASLVPTDWLDDLTERTVADIEASELDVHELICALRLAETETLPARFKERLGSRLAARALELVAREPAEWTSYNPQPLWFAFTPRSLAAAALTDLIPVNLGFLVGQQAEDGSWAPPWDWGGFYPEIWEQAKRDASSMLTLRTLRQLHEFGCIEGIAEAPYAR